MKRKNLLLSLLFFVFPIVSCSKGPSTYDVSFTSSTQTINFNGQNKASSNADYTFTLSVKEDKANDYVLPASITILVNDVSIASDKYTYNSTNGQCLIKKEAILGNIKITAEGQKKYPVMVFHNVTFLCLDGTLKFDGADIALEKAEYKCSIIVVDPNSYTLPDSITVKVKDETLVAGQGYKYDREHGEIEIYGDKVVDDITISASAKKITRYEFVAKSDSIEFDPVDPYEIPLGSDFSVNFKLKDELKDKKILSDDKNDYHVKMSGEDFLNFNITINSDAQTGVFTIDKDKVNGGIYIEAEAEFIDRSVLLNEYAIGLSLYQGSTPCEKIILPKEVGETVSFDIAPDSRKIVNCPKDVVSIMCGETDIKEDCTIEYNDNKLSVSFDMKEDYLTNDIIIDVEPVESRATMLRYQQYYDPSKRGYNLDVKFNFTTAKASDKIEIDWGDGIVQTYTGASCAEHTFSASIKNSIIIITGSITSITSFDDRDISDYVNNIDAIVIGSTITNIPPASFSRFRNLGYVGISVNSTISSIDGSDGQEKEGAFQSNSSLTFINIPASVKQIGNRAFESCSNLKTVYFPEDSKLETIGDKAFSHNGGTYSDGFTDFKIPSTVTSIGERAFSRCDDLVNFNYNSAQVNEISDYMFFSCRKLKTIDASPSITRIGNYAFCNSGYSGNNGNLEISSSISNIGISAFYGCRNINTITFADNASFNTLPAGAFGYTNIKTIKLPKNITSIGSFGILDAGAFEYCEELESVDLSLCAGLKELGNSTFYGCINLRTVKFNSRLETIGAFAFSNCDNLENFEIPSTVKNISNNAFDYSDISKYCLEENGGLYIKSNGNNHYFFYKPVDVNVETLTISSNCEIINANAFKGCTKLKTLIIPSTVKYINNSAFDDCASLTYNVKDNGCYLGNEDDTYHCFIKTKTDDIQTCLIDDSCRVIADGAFDKCSQLSKVYLPSKLTSIKSTAFDKCPKLEYNEYNNGLYLGVADPYSGISHEFLIKIKNKDVKSFATNVETYVIADGVFDGCDKLENVYISCNDNKYPVHIGEYAFNGCTSLKEVSIASQFHMAIAKDSSFDGCNENLKNITIKVRSDFRAAYMESSYWKRFNIEVLQ